ncbi:hypothetical protein PCANC_00162 [Puccinia coronata f. sp. avenae]|uniref:Uncharacterized protein n=1 Tax=Puccinia coronata f. sp. avenae TaxID=200324 RepID=A0A2N5W8H8_9BASI|nr:hypothetical protein PCANC_00162 [Puccinia coronata f. sp. avenae]
MQELKSPRSTTGHLLQFLEPESSHWYQNIPFNNPVRLSLDLIQGHSAAALEIIQKRLESAAQARNVEQTIVKILKPKGLQLFLSFFKTQSPRSSHNF